MPARTILRGAVALRPDGRLVHADVLIEDERIAEVRTEVAATEDTAIADVDGLTLLPGFIDVHVHGGGGHSLITNDAEEVRRYARWVVSRGVTSFLATICGDSLEHGLASARTATESVGPIEGGATLVGLNYEGPFISPERLGAIPRDWLQAPTLDLLKELDRAANGTIAVMTVAPELESAIQLIAAADERGIVVSIGHTNATYDQALLGFAAGARHVTHAFNAMRPLHHRDPGPLAAARDWPEATIEVIADGVHLHPATVRLLTHAFGADRVCLVTDAVRPAGLDEGVFRIGGQEAHLESGAIRLPDGTIAGSAATMDTLVRNVVAWEAGTLTEAAAMASTTPARMLGLEAQKGALIPGFDADIVALTPGLEVAKTWVAGQCVYDANHR